MSIIAMDTLTRTMQNKLGEYVPSNLLSQVLETMSDVLVDYDIQQIVRDDGEKDILLETFIEALKVEGRSAKTLERYEYIIRRFLSNVSVATKSVTVFHIRKYLADEKDRGISDNTINGYRMVFSSYFGWLYREGLISKNPMSNIGTIKCEKKVKEIYSEVDIEKLKTGCMTKRDKAIVNFLKATGCRISEVTQLNKTDVDLVKHECIVLGKGNKQRTVYFDAVTAMALEEYFGTRTDDSPALFAGKGSARLTPGGVRFMLKRLSGMTGVKHVHPHKFRRTQITNLVDRGMPLELVRNLAGHSKLDTTLEYVVTTQSNVKNAYEKFMR